MNDITALMATMKAAAIAVARDGRTDDEWFYYLQCVHHKNVLALVEALEKAQSKATQQGNISCELFDEVNQLRRTADDKAPELRAQLIEADSELETLRQRIAELESRTVTVKLPAEYLNADGSVNADMANTCPVVSAYREAHRAAGIQVIEGEGQ